MRMVRGRLSRPPNRIEPPAKAVDPFYRSTDWVLLARAIKAQRGYRCEACDRDCSDNRRALIADHVIERRDGGADLDPLNVRLMCLPCHNAKTAHARSVRR